jgi:DNA-binding IclR family transcriptional regulator
VAGAAGVESIGRAVRPSWAFLTNHGNVLLCIDQDPEIRLRDVAVRVGITERAAQSIVADLVHAGYLSRERVGRRNRYGVRLDGVLRTPLDPERPVAALVQAFREDGSTAPTTARAAVKAG